MKGWRAAAACLAVVASASSGTVRASARDLAQEGRRHMDAGRLDEAFSALRSARDQTAPAGADRELGDFLALTLYNLGVRFNNDGRAEEALACFIEALRLGPAAPRLKDARFHATLEEAALAVAAYLVQLGRGDGPLAAYRLLLEGGAPGPRVWLALGDLHLQRGELERAGEAFERAGDLDPRSAAAAAGRGRVAVRAASSPGGGGTDRPALLETGVDLLTRAAALEPGSAGRAAELAAALALLSRAQAGAGRIVEAERTAREAEAAFRRGVELDPSDVRARVDLALHLMARRHHGEAARLLESAEADLTRAIAERPGDRQADAWRASLRSCRESRAAALYDLAVDALNQADFDRADGLLVAACALGEAWEPACRSFREALRARREAFAAALERHESALRQRPGAASDLLALGDLYATIGAYDRALDYYRRLEGGAATDVRVAERVEAASDPGDPPEIRRTVELAGAGRVEIICYRQERVADLERAARAAWLRVSAALGQDALGDGLVLSVHPNQRAFRERAGYRVGAFVKGHYAAGRVGLFDAASRTPVEWVSVMTHEMAHHAVHTLSGGTAPWWLGEGIARYVEGDGTVVDLERLRRRLEAAPLPDIARLDELSARSWNDAEGFLDARDVALLAVLEAARRGGPRGLRELLLALRRAAAGGPQGHASLDDLLRGAVGLGLAELDEAWRATLRQR